MRLRRPVQPEPNQDLLVLSEREAPAYDLRSHLRFLAAPAHTPIAELAKPETAQRFVPPHRFGRPRDVTDVWVRLRLKIAQDSRDPWLLSVSSMIVLGYAVTAYWQENQTWHKRQLTRITPLTERPVPDAAATFAIPGMLQENPEIYLCFKKLVI